MHRSRLGVVVIDCRGEDLADAARFWSGALGYAFDIDADGTYAVGKSPEGEPRMLLQRVAHESRAHLDIETDDREAECARLAELGAEVVARSEKGWIVMEAPTGHRFCIVKPQRGDFADRANIWEG